MTPATAWCAADGTGTAPTLCYAITAEVPTLNLAAMRQPINTVSLCPYNATWRVICRIGFLPGTDWPCDLASHSPMSNRFKQLHVSIRWHHRHVSCWTTRKLSAAQPQAERRGSAGTLHAGRGDAASGGPARACAPHRRLQVEGGMLPPSCRERLLELKHLMHPLAGNPGTDMENSYPQ